jgi:RNA polymerase sigma-70 factor (sigma-E family)
MRTGGAILNSHGECCALFEAYARNNRDWLLSRAYAMCRDWGEAEDLVQLTLLSLYRRWDRLTDQGNLFGYASRTLSNLYMSEHRRRRWTGEVLVAALPERPIVDGAVEERMVVVSAVEQLPLSQQRIVMLRYWQDLSIDQTAQALGCSAGNVTSQTSRALGTLRSLLTSPAGLAPLLE